MLLDIFSRAEPAFGKRISEHLYVHWSTLPECDSGIREIVDHAILLTNLQAGLDFNVIKLRSDGAELSLLDYPDFFETAFPILRRSWRIRLESASIVFRTYEQSRNPPILHRKELLLLPDDPRIPQFQALTFSAEMLGLFEDPSRIGFQEQWYALIRQRGYELDGFELLPIANDVGERNAEAPDLTADPVIRRYRTALSRSNLSAPVQALWRHGLIAPGITVFDYGCGKGDDVRGLSANGIDASGWDPHYCPDVTKRIADVVNLGFVINVIEDLTERVEVLTSAYQLTSGTLSVAAMLANQSGVESRPHKDGYLTSHNTFQKYYSQLQLRDFIEATLDEPAIAVGPGVFFVFRDKALEQRFFVGRYGRKASFAMSRGWVPQRPASSDRLPKEKAIKLPKIDKETALFLAHEAVFQSLWECQCRLGRPPEAIEVDTIILQQLGNLKLSLARALRMIEKRLDHAELERSREQKRSDLLVFAALQQFQKRRPYCDLDSTLQRDIRYFFGTYQNLQATARSELFSLSAPEKIDAVCRRASERGLGCLDDSHSLQFHSSLLRELPPLLRIYVGCATALAGDIEEFDLIKLHIRSGKVSLMKYDDFDQLAAPSLEQRIKVRLRDLELDIYDYGTLYPASVLFNKSRYINEEFAGYAQQVQFDEDLARLGLFDLEGYGPPIADFTAILDGARWEVAGNQLRRSQSIPLLDSLCGQHLTYGQLIACGDTQHRTGISNAPVQPDSYTALFELATNVLDPVIDFFGMIDLTYGFCSATLTKEIIGNIAPPLDQHAAHEMNRVGKPICSRLGAACDFLVVDEDMEAVALWIAQNIPFDRIYFYGKERPLHVSYSSTPARQFVRFVASSTGKRIPKIDRSID